MGNACTELRGMYLQCLAHKVDIVCGDGNQSWYFRSKTHKAERTDALGNGHPEPLNGLVNTVARFEVSRYNKGLPLYDRACMAYVDNKSYEVKSCPESQYNMWDCCFIQLFSYGKLPYDYADQRATERNISRALYEEIIENIWARDHIDLQNTLPRAWPLFLI